MGTTAAVFDDKIERWKHDMQLPWGKLKYKLGQANLAKHLGPQPMNVLDAGGGNGFDAIPFAERGDHVAVVDYSREMLADLQDQAARENIGEHLSVHLADLKDLPVLFPEPQFDLVLCHNVLQYVEDVPALLGIFENVLKVDGLISIISINRFSAPYHAAFLDNDLAEALARLEVRTSKARIFDAVMTTYCADEIKELLKNAGFVPEGDYGIRCLCDYWGDNERKLQPETFEQIERLEFALTGLYPYKLLGRYFQVVARKAKAPDITDGG